LAYGLLIFMVTVDVINSHTKAMTLWKLTMAITFVRGVQGIILHVLEVGRPYYGTQMIYYDYADSILLLGGLFSLLAWRLTERRRSPKVPLLLLVLPILYSFLFSFRRSFWLGAIFGGLTLMLYARPRGKAVIASWAMAVLAVSCLTLVLLLVVPKFQPLQVVAQRVTSIVDTQNDPSNFFRVLDTQNALHAIYASGTIGSGFGSRYAVVASAPGLSDFIFDASRASHNGYLYLAMKLGVLGAISWVVLAVSIGRLGVSLLKHKSPISRGIAMAVLATLVANAVAALFLPLFYNVRPMVMLSILAGLVTSAWMLDAGR
jgi:O-antigen ligase